MKKIVLLIITFLGIFLSSIFFSFSDTNGAFLKAEDIVPGLFGGDETGGLFKFNGALIIKNKINLKKITLNGKTIEKWTDLPCFEIDFVCSNFNINGIRAVTTKRACEDTLNKRPKTRVKTKTVLTKNVIQQTVNNKDITINHTGNGRESRTVLRETKKTYEYSNKIWDISIDEGEIDFCGEYKIGDNVGTKTQRVISKITYTKIYDYYN
jgi:hypothetical protein